MNLGENIKKARKAAGVTQKELAERLQVYQKDISRWENNEGEWGARTDNRNVCENMQRA